MLQSILEANMFYDRLLKHFTDSIMDNAVSDSSLSNSSSNLKEYLIRPMHVEKNRDI
jgi:hypothetical protein